MAISKAFIPSAGFGSRMGELGKLYPKPLWPLFETYLLELQIYLLKDFGVNEYIVNTHFLSPIILEKMINHHSSTTFLYEEELLGSGGCFLNIKKNIPTLEKIVVLNSDIQIFFSKNDKERLLEYFDKFDAVMVCLPVEKESGYNEVVCDEDNFFHSVEKPDGCSDYLTYSGMGLINLSLVEGTVQNASFFESIVNNKFFKTKIFTPQDSFEYWDWGTLDLYRSNIRKLTFDNSFRLENFLMDHGLVKHSLLGENRYNSGQKLVYNFTGKKLGTKNSGPGIHFCLMGGDKVRIEF